jgi:peptide/nickel transport system substrate-binding protein
MLAGLALATAAPAAELRFGVSDLPRSMGNPYTENGTPSSYTWSALFDALTRLDGEGQLVPALATGWAPVSDDTWRFSLRPGVSFSNGEPFDARAVVATLRWLTSPEGRRTLIGNEVRGVVAVEAIDDHTVDVVTAVPDAILPQRLSAAMIVAPLAWAELGPEGFARQPAGTGPYVVADWDDARRRVRLEANPRSWRAPVLPVVHLMAMPDNAVRVQALRSREVDLTHVDIEDVDFLASRGFNIDHRPSMQVMALAFNTEREPPSPVRDRRVREALNLAVDRQAIAEVLLQGLVEPAGQPASRVTPGYNPAVPAYPYDPDRARALLAEAGYGEGLELRIEAVSGGIPGANQIFQVVVQDLRRVGVRASLQLRPFSAWVRDYLGGTMRGDLFGLPWNAAPYNDVLRPIEYYSCAQRRAFFCEPSVMPMIEAAGRELDPERRNLLMQELASVLHELAPSLFLVEQIVLYASSPAVTRLEIANRIPVYETLEMEPGLAPR